jgi:predicted transposase/invertase (TIGR01784 family)
MNTNKPHDPFLKSLLADTAFASSFLEGFLPKALVEVLELKSIQHEKGSFVSKALEESFADALFRVPIKGQDTSCFISVLLEHKSAPDQFAAFQMLSYLAGAYRAQLKGKQQLRPILPLLFYQGNTGWEFRSIRECFDPVYDVFLRFIPSFDTLFVELGKVPDDQILMFTNAWVQAALLAQKYSYDEAALISQLKRIFNSIAQAREGNFFSEITIYITRSLRVDLGQFITLIQPHLTQMGTEGERLTVYDQLIKKGYDEGLVQGVQKGLEQGVQKGLEQGVKKGLEQGVQKNTREIILRGYQNDISIQTLALLTGLSEAEIKEVIQMNGDK